MHCKTVIQPKIKWTKQIFAYQICFNHQMSIIDTSLESPCKDDHKNWQIFPKFFHFSINWDKKIYFSLKGPLVRQTCVARTPILLF